MRVVYTGHNNLYRICNNVTLPVISLKFIFILDVISHFKLCRKRSKVKDEYSDLRKDSIDFYKRIVYTYICIYMLQLYIDMDRVRSHVIIY